MPWRPRLSFFVGLSLYWDGYYESQGGAEGERVECTCSDARHADGSQAGPYEPTEPEATWLEGTGPSGRVVWGATSALSRSRRRRAPFALRVEGDQGEEPRRGEDEAARGR